MKKNNYKVQDSCRNCGFVVVISEYEENDDLYCGKDSIGRPHCGSFLMEEEFSVFKNLDRLDQKRVTKEKSDKWFEWSKDRHVSESGICDDWYKPAALPVYSYMSTVVDKVVHNYTLNKLIETFPKYSRFIEQDRHSGIDDSWVVYWPNNCKGSLFSYGRSSPEYHIKKAQKVSQKVFLEIVIGEFMLMVENDDSIVKDSEYF